MHFFILLAYIFILLAFGFQATVITTCTILILYATYKILKQISIKHKHKLRTGHIDNKLNA